METRYEPDFGPLKARVLSSLQELSKKIETETHVRGQVGAYSNESFPLSASLSIIRNPSGDEIAICVVVTTKAAGDYTIDGDIVGPDNLILAEAQSVIIRAGSSRADLFALTERWANDFEHFLHNNFDVLRMAVDALDK